MRHLTVIATIKVPGFHNWPEAPDVVAYLREEHRHVFTIRAFAKVEHADREVEFHCLQRWMRDHMHMIGNTGAKNAALNERVDEHSYFFGARSCEHIAEALLRYLAGKGVFAVEVWEDDENGSRVEYDGEELAKLIAVPSAMQGEVAVRVHQVHAAPHEPSP